MVRFSCADFAFPLLTHENSLKLIKLMGIDWVDIGLFQDRSHIQPEEQLKAPEKNGLALKKKADDIGLGISDIFLQSDLKFQVLSINDPDPAVRAGQRDVFLRLLEYTQAAGCKHITGLPGCNFGPDSWDICREEMIWRIEQSQKAGITYGVEAHSESIIEAPAETIRMLNEAKGLTLTLDHSHYTFRGESTESIRPLMKYASHMHMRGAAPGVMQAPMFDNTTDFKLVTEHMKEAGYDNCVCMEYTYTEWEDCRRTDNVSESIILIDMIKDYLGMK